MPHKALWQLVERRRHACARLWRIALAGLTRALQFATLSGTPASDAMLRGTALLDAL